MSNFKWFFFSLLAMPLFFSSCDKDEDSADSSNGLRLVRKLTEERRYLDGYWIKFTTSFSYDTQNRVIKTESECDELNRYGEDFRYFNSEIFVYGDGEVDYERREDGKRRIGKATLNAKGFVDTCSSKNGDEAKGEEITIVYGYNEDGRLSSSVHRVAGAGNKAGGCGSSSSYVWEDADLVRTSMKDGVVESKSNFTYRKYANKGNLDLNTLFTVACTRNQSSVFELLGYSGVRSKHLAATVSTLEERAGSSRVSISECSYELDGNGYVVKAIVNTTDGETSGTTTYTIEWMDEQE